MGRKTKNVPTKVHLAFKEGAKIWKYRVKIPFVYRLTVIPTEKVQTGEEVRILFVKPESNLDLAKKEFENKYPYKIVKIRQYTERWTDLCPRCRHSGIPKIEMKDSHDRRTRRPTHLGEIEKSEIRIKRPEEYWLTFTHKITDYNKTRSKKCRIRQYMNTPAPASKQNSIEIEKFFFTRIIGNLKNDSIWYADKSQPLQ